MLLYKSTVLCKNHPWLLLCVKLSLAFIQIIMKNHLFSSVSSEFQEKFIVTQIYYASTHISYCYVENGKFPLILVGTSFSQILQRLDKYVYMYQEIDCFYTLFKHRFYSSIDTSSGEIFNPFSRAVQQTLRWKGVKKMPSIAKKRLIRNECKSHHLIKNLFPHKLLVHRF